MGEKTGLILEGLKTKKIAESKKQDELKISLKPFLDKFAGSEGKSYDLVNDKDSGFEGVSVTGLGSGKILSNLVDYLGKNKFSSWTKGSGAKRCVFVYKYEVRPKIFADYKEENVKRFKERREKIFGRSPSDFKYSVMGNLEDLLGKTAFTIEKFLDGDIEYSSSIGKDILKAVDDVESAIKGLESISSWLKKAEKDLKTM